MRATIKSQGVTAVIDTHGAELVSLKDGAGVERLWSGDPAFWASQAPIMFPIVGGLHDNAYLLEGQRYEMGKHGFARHSEFVLESADESSAVFLLTDNEGTEAQYPFAFAFRAAFQAEGNRLVVRYLVSNLDAKVMPFQVGGHEAYATPEGLENYEIVFDQEETLNRRELAGNFISRSEQTPMLKNQRVMKLLEADFLRDAIVFLDVQSTGVTLQSKLHPRKIRVDFPGFETLMFWQAKHAPYICIEPWCGAADFEDGAMELEKRHRIRLLPPGETFVCEHVIGLS